MIESLNKYFEEHGFHSHLCSTHQEWVRQFLLIQYLEPHLCFSDTWAVVENFSGYVEWRMLKKLPKAHMSMIKDLLQKLGLWYLTDENG